MKPLHGSTACFMKGPLQFMLINVSTQQTENLVVNISVQAEVVLETCVRGIQLKGMCASKTSSSHSWAEENTIGEF